MVFYTTIGAREIPIGKSQVETVKFNNIEYVPVRKVVTTFGGSIYQVTSKIFVFVKDSTKEREIVFDIAQKEPRVLVDKATVSLPIPVYFIKNELYLPVLSLGEIFPLPEPVVPKIDSLSISVNKDTTTAFIRVDTTVAFYLETPSSLEYRLYLQATISPEILNSIEKIGKGLIKQIVIANTQGVDFRFRLKNSCDKRIQKTASGIAVKFFPRSGKKLYKIVIDPGHGGKDPGAIGKFFGLQEKVANLDIALRLKKKLENAGFEPLMTRQDDRFVSLKERTDFARKNQADLFLSIHCNSTPKPKKDSRGFETYFLSEAKTDWARAVEARENAALRFEVSDTNPITADEIGLILSDLAQNEFLKQSQDLAVAIQEDLCRSARLANRGVQQANFFVLRGSFMPAVLIECGFLSNRQEEQLLKKADFREKIAAGIFNGIKRFIKNYEQAQR